MGLEDNIAQTSDPQARTEFFGLGHLGKEKITEKGFASLEDVYRKSKAERDRLLREIMFGITSDIHVGDKFKVLKSNSTEQERNENVILRGEGGVGKNRPRLIGGVGLELVDAKYTFFKDNLGRPRPYYKVKVTDGDYKGQTGYVALEHIDGSTPPPPPPPEIKPPKREDPPIPPPPEEKGETPKRPETTRDTFALELMRGMLRVSKGAESISFDPNTQSINEGGLIDMIRILGSNPPLKRLDIHGQPGAGYPGMAITDAFIVEIKKLTNLEELNIRGTKITQTTQADIEAIANQVPQLKKISWGTNQEWTRP